MIVWEISRKRSSPESTIIIPAVLLVAKDVPVPQALIAFLIIIGSPPLKVLNSRRCARYGCVFGTVTVENGYSML